MKSVVNHENQALIDRATVPDVTYDNRIIKERDCLLSSSTSSLELELEVNDSSSSAVFSFNAVQVVNRFLEVFASSSKFRIDQIEEVFEENAIIHRFFIFMYFIYLNICVYIDQTFP